jgi:hypothetical protein
MVENKDHEELRHDHDPYGACASGETKLRGDGQARMLGIFATGSYGFLAGGLGGGTLSLCLGKHINPIIVLKTVSVRNDPWKRSIDIS